MMRRATTAVVAGASGALPFVAWLVLPPESVYSQFVTARVGQAVAEYDHMIWKRGDRRPKRIILMRHGRTHGYSHTCDCQVAGLPVCALKPETQRPLTEEGKMQALQAGVGLKHIIGEETCTFLVSPYKSCKQSFSYASGSFSNLGALQYVEDARLRNQDFGNWHLQTPPEKMEEYQKESEKVGSFYYRWPGGESASDVHDRVSSLLETLYRKWKHVDSPQNFVIVTHQAVIHCFLMRWFHWDVETFHRLKKFKAGQLAVMEKQEDGSYKLVSPLPIDPPIPDGVKIIASNPSNQPSD